MNMQSLELVGAKKIVLTNEHSFDFVLGRCIYPDTRPPAGFHGRKIPVTVEIVNKGIVKVGEIIEGFDDHGNEVFLACCGSEKIIYYSKPAAEGYIKLFGKLYA